MVEDVEFLREVFEKQSTFLDIIDGYRSSHHLLTYSTCQKHKDIIRFHSLLQWWIQSLIVEITNKILR